MLTPEEEKKRAIRISQLYDRENKVGITEEPGAPKTFPAYRIWKLSLVLLLPIVTIYALVNLFLGLRYNFVADIQGASIAFVCALIVIGLVALRTLEYYRRHMKSLLGSEAFLFWLIILFLLPLVLLVGKVFGFDSAGGTAVLFLKLSSSALLLLLFSSLYFLLLAYIVERSNAPKRYLVAFLLAVLPGLAYAFIS